MKFLTAKNLGWQVSNGIGGRFQPEQVAGLERNGWQVWPGIRSGSTVWRWLNEDAIKPWQYRSWIFPRDPEFEQKAGRVLDLYQGIWQGFALRSDEYVICADEKTSIQARNRKHVSLPTIKRQCMRIEHEYKIYRIFIRIIWHMVSSQM